MVGRHCRYQRGSESVFAVAFIFSLLVLLGSCGGKPIPFPTPESELGDRPGLLTGEKGAWEI